MRARRVYVGIIGALSALVMLTGCSQTVEGTAARAGSGNVQRNNDSQGQDPNLLKECEVLTEDILAEESFPVFSRQRFHGRGTSC